MDRFEPQHHTKRCLIVRDSSVHFRIVAGDSRIFQFPGFEVRIKILFLAQFFFCCPQFVNLILLLPILRPEHVAFPTSQNLFHPETGFGVVIRAQNPLPP